MAPKFANDRSVMVIQIALIKVPFNAGLVGAAMQVMESTRRLGRLTEMDGNCFEISAHTRCLSLPNSSNKSIKSP